ncbi:MAG: hypothetical protein A3J47_01280 [Candidatus Yanofskybacteria bacterium RIFCSPHIGHO2_02_FULL_43_22]|uniref:Uncharacterized protein n=1 Tax=Candidatus Yanofskybacteria bacterium RIFCSPHIGHO2_02_FULL_43_22 TaxID=1802681 RepID=A0A1F8FJ18_9BACT|nr:MAG: hypothetical protein A3J47_01280 [Candidatus Yanofskybacteria bacterium RIFCSPHIGHO2_02_FULL_43_22]
MVKTEPSNLKPPKGGFRLLGVDFYHFFRYSLAMFGYKIISKKLLVFCLLAAGIAVLFFVLVVLSQSSQARKNRAVAYLLKGDFEKAKAEFAKVSELSPNEKGVHLPLGLYYLDRGQYDEAKLELEKEIEIDPNQFVAYHNLGRIYAQRKNYKEAENYFLKTIEINPDHILARQDIVVLYFSQNKHPQAIVQLKELLRLQKPEAMHPQIIKILETYIKEAKLQ